jgi:hypothetical protein
MSAFSATVGLAARQRIGLADDGRGADGDRQVAVRDGAGRQRDGLVHHDGAGAGVDDHARPAWRHRRQVLDVGQEGDALVRRGGARTRTTRPSSAWATPAPLALLMAWATARAVAKSLLLRSSWMMSPRPAAWAPSARPGARRDAAGAQVVDLHLGAAGRGAGAADDQVALGDGVDLAVGAAQRRGSVPPRRLLALPMERR